MCKTSVNYVKILFDVLFCLDPKTRTTTTFLLIGLLRKLVIKNSVRFIEQFLSKFVQIGVKFSHFL